MSADKPCVLVTGASSGIGEATALKLAQSGWRVFAGMRKVPVTIPSHPDILPISLDVTSPDSLAAAFDEINRRTSGTGLNALVNNAGIGSVGPMECVDDQEIKAVFDVNVFGLLAVTRTFLPLLRTAKGRIVNIGSVGGLVTIPFGGVLCASKHAVEAINDALRQELMLAGIHVVLIRPASINSPAAVKLACEEEKIISGLISSVRDYYEKGIRHFLRQMLESEKNGSDPKVVAEVIREALHSDHPKTHYLAGKDSHILSILGKFCPDRLRDKLIMMKLGLSPSSSDQNKMKSQE